MQIYLQDANETLFGAYFIFSLELFCWILNRKRVTYAICWNLQEPI